MQRVLPLVCAAVLGFISPVRAEESKAERFPKGMQVVVVGPITSPPKGAINEKKMQVAIGPERTDYTLHFRQAELTGLHGQKIDEDAFDDGQWVRAEGRATDDRRRIDVSRIQIIAPDQKGLKRSAFYRTGFDHGYISSVAGTRQTFPDPTGAVSFSSAPFVMVGRVSDDTGPFERTRRIQVKSAGNTWTLHVPKEASIMDVAGKKISVHDVSEGQWVRVHGWRTDDLRMRVDRLENIGKDEAFRTSSFFRTEYPLGYVDPLEGNDRFTSMKMSGTVVRVDPEFSSVTLRDEAGVEHTFYGDTATMMIDGKPVMFDRLRSGDRISIESRTIRFQ